MLIANVTVDSDDKTKTPTVARTTNIMQYVNCHHSKKLWSAPHEWQKLFKAHWRADFKPCLNGNHTIHSSFLTFGWETSTVSWVNEACFSLRWKPKLTNKWITIDFQSNKLCFKIQILNPHLHMVEHCRGVLRRGMSSDECVLVGSLPLCDQNTHKQQNNVFFYFAANFCFPFTLEAEILSDG